MPSYFALLLESELPFSPPTVALSWVALYVANHLVARMARAATDAQRLVQFDGAALIRRSLDARFVAAQVLMAAVVFAVALFLGEPAFALLAGGLVVALVCTLGLNVQGVWSAWALRLPGAAHGALALSTPLGYRQIAHRLGGSAVACGILGILLAQLALLGGAAFLGATAAGYLRRARSVPPAP
jgi:hypothetical protein